MSFKTFAVATVAALVLAVPAFADTMIKVDDPYARVAGSMATAGAAFMVIENTGDQADQLIEVRSDISKRVELHTHKENADGVMQMIHVEEGFAIPAGGKHMLMRGGDHVMFMGLNQELKHGDTVSVTLVFEKAGEVIVDVPVDLERKAMHGSMDHSN